MTRFYREVVGCEQTFAWEEPPTYVILKRGSFVIHLSKADDYNAIPSRRPFAYVFVHDTDEMHKNLVSNGAQRITSPDNAIYKMRDFELMDPENNVIVFGKGD